MGCSTGLQAKGRGHSGFLASMLVALLLLLEHGLLRGGRMDRIMHAFFHVNVTIAFAVMFGTILDLLLISGRMAS